MMEHIKQFDWCTFQLDTQFVFEEDLDNCVTEKILRNKFHDPLISSESEEEVNNVIDWNEVFTKKKTAKEHNYYVPVLHAICPHPKLSAISSRDQYQSVKVISYQNRNILPARYIPRPTKSDLKVFEEIQDLYKKEQKEYIEWVNTLWTNGHCSRALRPKPGIENLYKAEFKLKAQEMKSFPKTYAMAAQIPLSMRSGKFQMLHQEDLVKVKTEDLPNIDYPTEITKSFNILRPIPIPEPCLKHLCRFILPGENSVTILPLTEMHRELAQYASENGCQFVASESALRSIVDTNRTWTLPVSVCETIEPDGEKFNVIVIGSECLIEKEPAQIRTYRAYRHLLENAVIPLQEKAKALEKSKESIEKSPNKSMEIMKNVTEDMDVSSDDEERDLFIDTGDQDMNPQPDKQDINELRNSEDNKTDKHQEEHNNSGPNKSIIDPECFGVYSCICKDTIYENPNPRSFRKWKVKNSVDKENYDIVIHCSHKAKNSNEEVIMEPTIEYLLDLGASEIPDSRIDSLSLSLMLRQNASLLHARVEGPTGEVGTIELISSECWKEMHPNSLERGIERIVSALSQLRTLLPAHYLLHHKPSHGENAMLYASRSTTSDERIILEFENALEATIDEAKGVSVPPTISTALLPYHKHRSILPCAFTPYEQQVAKEPKKPVTKKKVPPQAIKWPKKKRNKKKQKKN